MIIGLIEPIVKSLEPRLYRYPLLFLALFLNIKMMKNLYSYIAVFLTISILSILLLYVLNSNIDSNEVKETSFSLQVKEKDSFWIYEIYNNNHLFISQEYIPAVQGKQVFKTKEDAEKIGKLVVSKLSTNRVPVINTDDLNTNNIYFDKI